MNTINDQPSCEYYRLTYSKEFRTPMSYSMAVHLINNIVTKYHNNPDKVDRLAKRVRDFYFKQYRITNG